LHSEEWMTVEKKELWYLRKLQRNVCFMTEGQSELAYAVSSSAFWVCLLTSSASICSCASSSFKLKSELLLLKYASRCQL